MGIPGAAGFVREWRLVSTSRSLEVSTVVGSMSGAPSYLRMAELTPSLKVALAMPGRARTQ